MSIYGEDRITAMRELVERVLPEIADARTRWLIPPDATTLRGTAVWTQADQPRFVFAVNYDVERQSDYFGIPALDPGAELHGEYSTTGSIAEEDRVLVHNGFFQRIENLAPGEARMYRVVG